MNALELANYMEDTERWNVSGVQMQNCAEMLRRQHEAIVKLREALNDVDDGDVYLPPFIRRKVLDALKDTEELA